MPNVSAALGSLNNVRIGAAGKRVASSFRHSSAPPTRAIQSCTRTMSLRTDDCGVSLPAATRRAAALVPLTQRTPRARSVRASRMPRTTSHARVKAGSTEHAQTLHSLQRIVRRVEKTRRGERPRRVFTGHLFQRVLHTPTVSLEARDIGPNVPRVANSIESWYDRLDVDANDSRDKCGELQYTNGPVPTNVERLVRHRWIVEWKHVGAHH